MAADTGSQFEDIDWDATEVDRSIATRTWLFLLAVGSVAVTFAYDYAVLGDGEKLAGSWNPQGVDWLYALSLAAFTLYIVVPLARSPRRTRYYWRRLRQNRLAVASLAWLSLFFVVGLLAPVIVGEPARNPAVIHNPPVGFTLPEILAGGCVGTVSNGVCHGSWAHPLGTTGNGRDVLAYVIAGANVALKVALITATLLVPIATVVGTVAAQFGGRVDTVLMRYVDIQQAIPAFFVYIVAQFLYYPTLALMVLIFGLLNWGSMARLVRADALQTGEEGFVLAAESSGNSPLRVVRKHIVPNVSTTILTAVTLQIPTLIIIEATLSYLVLGDPRIYSWGQMVGVGMREFPTYWWVPTMPVVALGLTVVSLNVLGDALRDAFDPEASR